MREGIGYKQKYKSQNEAKKEEEKWGPKSNG